MKKIKVGILGCGKIVTDRCVTDVNYVMSHLAAIETIKEMQIQCIFDPNQLIGENLPENYRALLTASEDFFWSQAFDLVVIASPTKNHLSDLRKALQHGISKIILEKPISHSLEEIEEFEKIFAASDFKSSIAINFPRHFDDQHGKIFDLVKKNELGNPLSYSAITSKGFIHNGIHMLDLVQQLFGTDFHLKPIKLEKISDDTLGLIEIEHKGFSGSFSCVRAVDYSLFELIIYFEKGRISFKNNGRILEISLAEKSDLYPTFKELTGNQILRETLGMAFVNTYKFLILQEKIDHQKFLNWLKVNKELIKMKDHYDHR